MEARPEDGIQDSKRMEVRKMKTLEERLEWLATSSKMATMYPEKVFQDRPFGDWLLRLHEGWKVVSLSNRRTDKLVRKTFWDRKKALAYFEELKTELEKEKST